MRGIRPEQVLIFTRVRSLIPIKAGLCFNSKETWTRTRNASTLLCMPFINARLSIAIAASPSWSGMPMALTSVKTVRSILA